MQILVSLQVIDRDTEEGIVADQDEIAELVESLISLHKFRTIPVGKEVTDVVSAMLVNVEASAVNEDIEEVQLGDYVLVVGQPDEWESSGEEDEDIRAWVGQVGIVVEIDPDLQQCLCRFPSFDNENETGQRNIEWEALTIVSRPAAKLTRYCLTEERETNAD